MPIDSKVDVNHLAGMSEGWSGADLEAMCKKAVMLALDECLTSSKDADLNKCIIAPDHFEQAITQNTFANDKSPAVRH